MGKSTISMAMFDSKLLTNYRRPFFAAPDVIPTDPSGQASGRCKPRGVVASHAANRGGWTAGAVTWDGDLKNRSKKHGLCLKNMVYTMCIPLNSLVDHDVPYRQMVKLSFGWGLKFQGVGWPPLFVAIKPCSNPPYYINGCLRSKTTKKKPTKRKHPPLLQPLLKDNVILGVYIDV